MTRQQIVILALLGTLNLVVLCGGALWLATMQRPSVSSSTVGAAVLVTPNRDTSPPTPSSTPVPATATLVLAPDPILALIFNAFEKTDSAASYRLQMDASASGSLAQVVATQNEIAILNLSGEVVGSDSYLVIKGFAMKRLTIDPAKVIETTNVAGKSYVKGPLPLLGAKENKWYVLPAGQSVLKESPSDLYSLFNGSSGLPVISKGGTEKLDSRVCDLYVGDKNAALAAFMNLGGTSQLSDSAAARLQSSIQTAEFKLWVCDDGYVHQMRMSFDGIDPSPPNSRFGFKILARIFDFGAKISILTPTDALPATPLIDLNPIERAAPTPFRIPTFGLPRFTPFATFAIPALTPFATFSFPFFSPNSTPVVK